jgi:hypothetical protein
MKSTTNMKLLSLIVPAALALGCGSSKSGNNGAPIDSGKQDAPADAGRQVAADAPATPLQTKAEGTKIYGFQSCEGEGSFKKTELDTWIYFNTDKDNGGASESDFTAGALAGTADSCSVLWSGSLVKKNDSTGYAQLVFPLGGMNLAGYKSALLKLRGAGQPFRFRFEASKQAAAGNWNMYNRDFSCGNGSDQFVNVVINFNEAKQDEGWGVKVDLDVADVGDLRIMTHAASFPADFKCEIASIELLK